MESCLDSLICLQLNRNWQRLGYLTPRKAVIAMAGGLGTPPALGLDLTIAPDGTLADARAVTWEEWLQLPIRDGDPILMTGKGPIRAPTVVVCPGYSKMPIKKPKLSKKAIIERDGLQCQYTGKKLTRKEANIDHVVPRSRGGRDTWENLVTSSKAVNSEKGNKTNAEAGLRLLKQPKAPPALPISAVVKEAKHPHHKPFMD
jgi:5-methylcytosine-specific restriction endonuclease McrA